MTFPKEGSREIDEGIIISEPMDWCRSPTAIVPYRIWARQIEATDLAYSVRQTKDPSHVRGSVVLRCYGDEPGTGGGVISGTHNAECTPKTWSETVRAESRNMVRHDDEWWMNNGNTWGRLDYVKDTTSYPTPQVASITPLMSPVAAGASVSRFSTDPTVGETSLVSSGAEADPSDFIALAPNAGYGDAIQPPDPPTRPKLVPNASEHDARDSFVRVSAGCDRLIGTYDEIKKECAGKSDEDMTDNDLSNNDHHLVPDYTMGGTRGCRENNTCRFANMPNFGDMPAICLKGYTSDAGSEHQFVQSTVNSSIANRGQMPTLADVIYWSKKDTIEIMKQHFNLSDACADKISKEIDKAFEGKDLSQHVRGYPSYNKDVNDYLMNEGGRFNVPPGSVVPPRSEW